MAPALDYCLEVWCLAADSHLKLQARIDRGDSVLAGGVLDCDLAHR